MAKKVKTPTNLTPNLSTPAVPASATGLTANGVVEEPMVAPAPKKGDKVVRGGTSAGRPGQIVTQANRWRENYNPIRGLTMRRVVELLELGQRGDYAYLQWTFRFIERRYPTLSPLISRCESAIMNFDWQVKTKPQTLTSAQRALEPDAKKALKDDYQAKAGAQKQALEEAYGAIDNLKYAIRHMASADFRGYAHLQKHRGADGDTTHLETLYQWCICRDGLAGNWFWNPDSRSTSAPLQVLGRAFAIGGDALPLEDFIIREVERPIDEIALVNFVRSNLCEKDADAFIEIYGIPGGVVEMPPNVPPGKESEYESAAQRVAEGGSGAIPNGSKYYANDGPRNVDPFTPRLAHLDEQVIMAGTGGKLTMLTESGSGTLAGNAHADTFQAIAEARAIEISECFQRQFDAEILEAQFPGEKCLAYFELSAKDETDVAALVKDVAELFAAGLEPDVDWLNEKTGYQMKQAETEPNDPEGDDMQQVDALKVDNAELGPKNQPIANRQAKRGKIRNSGNQEKPQGPSKSFNAHFQDEVASSVAPDLLLINKRMAALKAITDPELMRSRAADLLDWINANAEHFQNNPALQDALHSGMAAAFANGMSALTKAT